MNNRTPGRLDALAKRYTWTLPIVGGLSVVGTALEGVGVALIIPLLSLMLQGGASDSSLGPFGRVALLFPEEFRIPGIVGVILGLIVLKNALHVFNLRFMAKIEGQFGHDVRCALSQRLLDVGYEFFLAESPARVVNAITTESWRTSAGYRQILTGVAAMSALAVFGVLILVLEWRLALIVLAGTFVIRAIENRLIARSARLSHAVTPVNDELADRMLHNALAMRMLRIFGREQYEQQRFAAASDGVRRALLDVERASALVSPTLEILHIGLLVAVLLVALVTGAVELPALAAFLVLLQRAQPYLRVLEHSRTEYAAARGAFAEVEWLLHPAGKPSGPQGTAPIDDLRAAIEFRGVTFVYPGRETSAPALDRVSFFIRAGKSTALLGPSGAGKSTVINLLCRLMEPTAGAILVDGVNIATLDPKRWRAMIAVAGQDVDLSDGSIADNIAYGSEGCSRESVIDAARRADAHSFIEAMPQSYDTRVGTRGTNLSGGQRQRIGLARAFVRRPKLLILDEATNEIDGISESTILSLLRDHPDDMTICMISHRASALAQCDDGVALENGRVVETAPLPQLAAYRTMRAVSAERSGPAV
jgi:subfamily B ATP-binding cassette protein MsbA